MNIELQIADDLQSHTDQDFTALLERAAGADVTRAMQAMIDTWLRSIHSHIDEPRLDQPLCIRLCDSAESQNLNHTYRGKDKPTNVLSFPVHLNDQIEGAFADQFAVADLPLGDLAVCWPVLLEEAADQGKQPLHHLAHLLVHGVLHLLGHDHEIDAKAQIMEALEVAILADLGIDNPYT